MYINNISVKKYKMDVIVLSFIGKTQSYLNECIHQIRLFTDKPIYYIYNK